MDPCGTPPVTVLTSENQLLFKGHFALHSISQVRLKLNQRRVQKSIVMQSVQKQLMIYTV